MQHFLEDGVNGKAESIVNQVPRLDTFCHLFTGLPKNYVYTVKTRNLAHWERTLEAAEQKSGDIQRRVRQEVQYRLDTCRATVGARVDTD